MKTEIKAQSLQMVKKLTWDPPNKLEHQSATGQGELEGESLLSFNCLSYIGKLKSQILCFQY